MSAEKTEAICLLQPGNIVRINDKFLDQFDRNNWCRDMLVESVTPGMSWNPVTFWVQLTTNDEYRYQITGKLKSQIRFPVEWFCVVRR